MKIFLISGTVSEEKRYGKFKTVGAYMQPYGLLLIAAVLEKEGHEVKVLDLEMEDCDNNSICQQIKNYKPDLIGMSVFTIGYNEAVKRVKNIKKRLDIPTVVGGPHTFVDIDNFSKVEEIDYFVVGEGVVTILELLEALQGNRSFSDVLGLVYRENGKVIRNPDRPPIENLDDLPLPAFHLLSKRNSYHPMPLGYRRRPFYPLVTSRGCPFNCIFCSTIWGKKWRANSADYVVNALEKLVNNFGAREIWFCEDTFSLKKERVKEICQGIIDRNLDISWSCMANVHTFDEETLILMKKSGCWQIQLGLESGNNDVLKFIRKPITIELVREKVNLMAKIGIQVRGYFILDHLIDTKKTTKETVDFAFSLPLYSANFALLHLDLGSDARKIAENYGTVNYDFNILTGWVSDDCRLSFVPKGMTEEYLFKVQRKANLHFYLRPSQVFRMIKTIRSFEDIRRFALLFAAYLKILF